MNTVKRVLYVLGIVALILGLYGFYSRLFIGERDVNYGSYVTWGLWVAMYLFFAGIASGSFVIATLEYLFEIPLFKGTGKLALWAAMVTLPAALISIGMDLGHLERIWKVYLQPNPTSLLAQMVWGYTIFGGVILLSLWLVARHGHRSTFAVKALMMTPAPHSETVIHAGEDHQAALLAIVKGLVERVGSISDFLQSRSCLGHAIGLLAKASHLINGRLLLLCIILLAFLLLLLGLHPGIGAVDPKLGEIADGLFHRRPQLLLIRRQRKTGMNRRDPRIRDSRPILRAELHALMGPRVMLMGVYCRRTGDSQCCDTCENGLLLHWNSPLQGPIKMEARGAPGKLHLRKVPSLTKM